MAGIIGAWALPVSTGLADVSGQLAGEIAAALGVPFELMQGRQPGAAQREALRRLRVQTIEPLARVLEAEFAEKLEQPAQLVFDAAYRDLASATAALKRLMDAGIPADESRRMVGL